MAVNLKFEILSHLDIIFLWLLFKGLGRGGGAHDPLALWIFYCNTVHNVKSRSHGATATANSQWVNGSSEETFVSFGFESIFLHFETISNGRPIKVINDKIDISKLKSLYDTKISPGTYFA